jgi:hypothetical protein
MNSDLGCYRAQLSLLCFTYSWALERVWPSVQGDIDTSSKSSPSETLTFIGQGVPELRIKQERSRME